MFRLVPRLLSVLPTFDDSSANNSLVSVRIGDTLQLSCRIFMLQVFFSFYQSNLALAIDVSDLYYVLIPVSD